LPSIADYGLIGDGRTAALCSSVGSIDWMCIPRFDSDPVFGRLVGGDRAGSFSLRVDDVRSVSRRYRNDSAVLETTWRTGGGETTLTEGMVLQVSGRLLPQLLLVRRIECQGAPTNVRIRFDPKDGLLGRTVRAEKRNGALVCVRGSLAMALQASPAIRLAVGEDIETTLEPGRSLTFALGATDRHPLVLVDPEQAFGLLEHTDRWWRRWTSEITYTGPLAGSVIRSLITLRLLTYTPSGAPVAAPTTSLPEDPGGGRNWDYRYSWPRDASIGAGAFMAVGLSDEAHSFLHWLHVASRLTKPRMHVAYTIDGKPRLTETEVPEAPGYRDSRPVRLGNEAASQHQLDVYGWVLDAVWALVNHGGHLHPALWRATAGFADFVAEHWREPDAGIWELREEPAHYVHSKLMGWLALDRALRVAKSYRTKPSRIRDWTRARRELTDDVRARGFDPRRRSYVRAYGRDDLDAAMLVLPLLEFEPSDSPRLLGTIDAIRSELSAGGPLIYRYVPGSDGMEGGEGAFLPCSFWLVQALARTGRIEEARELFQDLCSRSSAIGLFAEQMDPGSGEHFGNFPQALTHAALIQAALSLDRANED
jgi:pentatricopeptide repeat protein